MTAQLFKTNTFTRRVNATRPNGSSTDKFSFMAEFKLIDRATLEGRDDGEILEDALVSVSDFMPAEMVSDGLTDEQLREAVINDLCASQAAVLAFLEAGKQEGLKRKTSKR